jgi:hypothetical protein
MPQLLDPVTLAKPREIGCPFVAPMVQALLRPVNPKTMTRRLRHSYRVGDRLWVREAYLVPVHLDPLAPREILPGAALHFMADGLPKNPDRWGRLRPGMFMCRWMARIELEVIAEREEPLQAISHDDACAEGIDSTRGGAAACIERYRILWDSLAHGDATWSANPMVWAYTFRRVKP